ncbi:hypothetical protein [Kaarinaea lacus]
MHKNRFGTLGVIAGLTALGIAFFHFWLGPLQPEQKSFEESVAEQTVRLKNAVAAKLKGEEVERYSESRSLNVDKIVTVFSVAVAFLAIVFAVLSFLQREDLRFSGTAAVLGVSAMAFQLLMVALGLVFLLVIVYAVLSNA